LLDSTDGFCSFKGFEFYKDKDFNKIMTFLGDIFELFTKEQIQYLYIKAINFTKITAQSTVTYCNSEVSEVLKIIEPTVDALLKGLKSGENNFASITLDHEALKATKEEGYQPFKMVNYA